MNNTDPLTRPPVEEIALRRKALVVLAELDRVHLKFPVLARHIVGSHVAFNSSTLIPFTTGVIFAPGVVG